jgi:outer membrane protein OmpA-like peptidoglycan-associated protein
MIRTFALTLAMMLMFNGIAGAGELGFENTSEGIARALLSPVESPSDEFKTRGLNETETSAEFKVRGITVVEKAPGQTEVVEEFITVPSERSGGFVNLAVRFDVASYSIRPDSMQLLDELGGALQMSDLSDRIVSINGHTDFDGEEEYNLRLSLNRAVAVKQYLVINHTISSKRLKIMGYGEGLPLVPNVSAANKQLNRRVEIVVVN